MSDNKRGIPALARWWHEFVGADEPTAAPPAAGYPGQDLMFAGPTPGALAAFLALRDAGLAPVPRGHTSSFSAMKSRSSSRPSPGSSGIVM